ncbi:hypothetical protein SAMN04487891_111105 [Flagellimonas taeanensis]|uniref:Uncharacterized protein n=1 Tax=Flagellimonas taeanensis TaxID=1005926 RepID=A0A1M6W8K8_9FLAO|nr:hypothetical protein [Allomuricauda taeanensis]SFC45364.1 hypothetical protein SAMN04487891_111105 [Allomuricauda taeanensis]SHK90093.1 hypothetical protein SAMN05216293_2204 [Allomuricauda taeanensis]
MNKLIIIFLLLISNFSFGQESIIESEIISVKCNESIHSNCFNTRLTKDTIVNHVRVVHFSTTATCCVDFEILSKGTENQIDIELEENGIPCDCICSYDFVIQLKSILNPKAKLSIKNMELKKDIPKLRPLEKRYFVFENDTIGFDDENGIRQGYIVYMRENDLKKNILS